MPAPISTVDPDAARGCRQAVLYLLSLSDRAAIDQIYIRRRNSSPF